MTERVSPERIKISQTTTDNDVDVLTIAAGDNNIGNVDVVTLPALVAGTANIGDVDVLTVPVPLSTQGAGTEAAALRVTIANDSTGVVSVDDNGGTLTVDDASLDNATLVDNAGFTDGTTRVMMTGYIFDDVAGTALTENDAAAPRINANRAAVSTLEDGVTRARYATVTAANALKVDASGVAVPVTDNGGNLSIDWAGTVPPIGAGTEAAALRVTIATDSTGVLSVDDNGGTLTVDQATAANFNAQVVGAAAHDAANSGNPVLTAASHETIADTAPTNRLASVTDGDVTRYSSTDGALFVIPTGPQSWQTVNTGLLTGATVKASPGAGLSLYVTAMQFSIGAATASSIKLTISAGADMVGPHYLEAINGRGVAFVFPTPLKVTAATALLATSTGAATSTLNVQGFTAPG